MDGSIDPILEKSYIINANLSGKYLTLLKSAGKKKRKAELQSRKSSITQKDLMDLQRAYSTYLNVTGPGEYTLPTLVYGKVAQSNKKNSPMFSFKQKTKLPYFP